MDFVDELSWYAIRVPYAREMKLRTHLDTLNIVSFIPMQFIEVTIKGEIQKQIRPIIRNLIFIFSSRDQLDKLKQELEYKIPIRYIIDSATKKPIVVADRDMRHFIAISNTMDEQLIYTTNTKPILYNGAKVRVKGGPFEGIEGRVVRIKKDRKVIASIDGVISVITTFIHPSLLEIIEP